MQCKLQFFSGQGSHGDAAGHGYDGSMTVNFNPDAPADEIYAALRGHARAMDCVFGPVVVVVLSCDGVLPSERTLWCAYQFEHACDA